VAQLRQEHDRRRADVENVDIPRLQALLSQLLPADNATLIVSGRFDAARVLEIVAQSFGPIPRPTRGSRRPTPSTRRRTASAP
jgi:predicted Zn-dependent peptidase